MRILLLHYIYSDFILAGYRDVLAQRVRRT